MIKDGNNCGQANEAQMKWKNIYLKTNDNYLGHL
jgi:hypothetical protein